MPSSRASTIPYVIYAIKQLRPGSILDVGVGFGKWGYLFREYTDIIQSESDPPRYFKAGWRTRIEGIEGHVSYIHDGHHFIYDKIHTGDARDILPTLGTFDVIFIGDMIEHLPMEDGERLLRASLKQSNKCVIVTTPKYDTQQTSCCNNPLECHRSVWRPASFRSIGPCLITLSDEATYVVAYPGPNVSHLKLRIEEPRARSPWRVFTHLLSSIRRPTCG